MKLVSNIGLTYSTGVSSTDTGIIEGHIISHEKDKNKIVQILFSYKKPDGTTILTEWFPQGITEEEADALYAAVAANLPDIAVVGFSAWNEALFYEAFRIKMAETFGVTTDKIDIAAE